MFAFIPNKVLLLIQYHLRFPIGIYFKVHHEPVNDLSSHIQCFGLGTLPYQVVFERYQLISYSTPERKAEIFHALNFDLFES